MGTYTLDRKIAHELKYNILHMDYKPGMALPPERELAERFGVQRKTIRMALQHLVDEKIIVARDRSGYYIRPPRCQLRVNENSIGWKLCVEKNDCHKDNCRKNVCLKAKLFSYSLLETDKHLSEKFRLPLGTRLHEVRRIYEQEGMVTGLEGFYVQEERFPDMMEQPLSRESVFSVFEDRNIEIQKSLFTTSLIYANEEEKEVFGLPLSTPLVKEELSLLDAENHFMAYAYMTAPIEKMEIMIYEWE